MLTISANINTRGGLRAGATWWTDPLVSPAAGVKAMARESRYLLAVKHLDVLYDAAVFLQDRDGLGQRHPWTRERSR